MTYTPTIYDWRESVAPLDQVFRAGGTSVFGGMTLGGASVSNPEPGGRAEMVLNFAPMVTEQANRDASWTISQIINSRVLRYRLHETVQLVPKAEINGTAADNHTTLSPSPADPEADVEFWDPRVAITAAAAKGAASLSANFSDPGEILALGHVVGLRSGSYDFAHLVTDVTYSSGTATVSVSPPLRRGLTTSDYLYLRPRMLMTCTNPMEVMANFQSGRHMALNTARFVEALV